MVCGLEAGLAPLGVQTLRHDVSVGLLHEGLEHSIGWALVTRSLLQSRGLCRVHPFVDGLRPSLLFLFQGKSLEQWKIVRVNLRRLHLGLGDSDWLLVRFSCSLCSRFDWSPSLLAFILYPARLKSVPFFLILDFLKNFEHLGQILVPQLVDVSLL